MLQFPAVKLHILRVWAILKIPTYSYNGYPVQPPNPQYYNYPPGWPVLKNTQAPPADIPQPYQATRPSHPRPITSHTPPPIRARSFLPADIKNSHTMGEGILLQFEGNDGSSDLCLNIFPMHALFHLHD
ncbi:hypothetical protein BDR03DRAFT_441853 [Suillus americanus]|nr:hypothetical protein BDR03DRAFT_441853 [Suillus americanus]